MYKIIRIEDGKTFETKDYKFITFDESGKGRGSVNTPEVGASLIIPPYNAFYRWMTSVITEVIDDYNFKTKNSTYKIEKQEA